VGPTQTIRNKWYVSLFLNLDKEQRRRHTVSKIRRRGEDECIMDRQYQYVPVDPSDHNGFLPDHTSDCIDPMAEKRIDEEAPISKHQMTNKFELPKFES
jgi:hypothetical protein